MNKGIAPLRFRTLRVLRSARDDITFLRSLNAVTSGDIMRNDYNFYVYILTNRHHTDFYIGVTDNLQRRAFEHANKLLGGFTAQHNVEKLVYFEHFTDIRLAIAREKHLKGLNRNKKLMLIEAFNPEWQALETLVASTSEASPRSGVGVLEVRDSQQQRTEVRRGGL